ncbi:SDR family NAD(P)-dependent oxidoreductase [Anoxybacterium hadale]|uniref:SDR family NAD(P)-dependent oxidoreductase n=1 Tax=Anoxybacterium hadale TaxID=3408580 RepID=A0ACD1AB23_9FIRM|nr:SDR family NAD(P)-dependent oxidoreductase [Clostridiales bacterium]
MNLEGKKILITGADGFIGSHLTEELVRRGACVTAFVLYNSLNTAGWLDSISNKIRNEIRMVSGDIRDSYRVKEAMKGCDVVFHLAALIAIPYSYESPASYIETNITGTLNVLQAARQWEAARVIHTSTSEVYGSARYVPIPEDHPLRGQSPYAASKIGADQLALSFYDSFSTPVAVIRPFNTYGPRQSARAVIPAIITQLAQGSQKINLGALSPTRDFNFVKDTVRGFIQVAESDHAIGEVVNIGSGFEISIGETAEMIGQIMGVSVEIQSDSARFRPEKSEVTRLYADISKAVRLFGWKPEYGGREGFRRGLEETVRWFTDLEHLKLYHLGRYEI